MKAEIEWVNQKERKPNDSVPVLVTNQKEFWLGDYSRSRNKGNGGWALVYNGAPPFNSEDVTHWASYPKLP